MSQNFDFQNLLLLTEDDPDFRQTLISSYVSNFNTFPSEYEQCMRANSVEGLRFLVHKVKATVRMVGADELERLLEQSPRLLEQGGDCQLVIDRVRELCQQLVAGIGRL